MFPTRCLAAFKHSLVHALLVLGAAACGDASSNTNGSTRAGTQTVGGLQGDFDYASHNPKEEQRDGIRQPRKIVQATGSSARDAAAQSAEAVIKGSQQAGDYAAEKGSPARETGENTADTVAHTAKDVAGDAYGAAKSAARWADELEKPILEQRERMCREENGYWAEEVWVSACENGHVTVTVDDVETQQDCEGEGPGQVYAWQCVYRTSASSGTYYFNDGPSAPHYLQRFGETISDRTNSIRWNELFWDAAVNHDYCYHHGKVTYNYARKDCDGQLLDDLLAICRSGRGEKYPWFDTDECMSNAQAMFAAVRQFGDDSFNVMNTFVRYPAYAPLFDALDVEREDQDDERRNQIESVTF